MSTTLVKSVTLFSLLFLVAANTAFLLNHERLAFVLCFTAAFGFALVRNRP